MSDPLIRAMAITLLDHGVDLLDKTAIIGTLIVAGFPGKMINLFYDDVICMAMMRAANERRKITKGCSSCGYPMHGSFCLKQTGLDLSNCILELRNRDNG